MTPPIAVVTGASRGVGRGVALALGTNGWTVYLTGRDEETLGKAAADVTAAGGVGVPVVCDHAVDAQALDLFARVDTDHSRLDLLVNNVWSGPADIALDQPFWTRPLSDWDSLVGIGLRAHYVASVAATPIMLRAGSGLIVNISSFGARGHLHSAAYGIAKAGLDRMAHAMAEDLSGLGVAVVSLWPGLVHTEAVEAMRAQGIESVMGFPITDAESPDLVGRVVHALATDPKLETRSGHTFVTAELAREYELAEADGRYPPSLRDAFGGGPLW